MEMSVVVVVVGAVVGRQWEVHWAASGQLSSVNPTTKTTTSSLSQPHAHLLWAHFFSVPNSSSKQHYPASPNPPILDTLPKLQIQSSFVEELHHRIFKYYCMIYQDLM